LVELSLPLLVQNIEDSNLDLGPVILARILRGFSQSLLPNADIMAHTTLQTLPSIFIPVRYSFFIVLFDNTGLFSLPSEILRASLNEPDKINMPMSPKRRSKWPRDLRHELYSPAQTLGSWVRIPFEAWMSVCVYSVFVLFCM
jgi:hypothetical protein